MAHGGAREGAGRHKGGHNKDTAVLVAMLKKKYPKWDPVLAMAEIATKNKDPMIQLQAAKEVAQYVYPKRKAIEHSGEVGQRVNIVDDIPAK